MNIYRTSLIIGQTEITHLPSMEWIHHPRYSYMIEYYKVFCAKIQACVQKGHCENKLKSHRKNTVSFFLFVSVVLPSTLLLQAREFLPFWWVLVMKMSWSWSVPRSQGYPLAPVVSALRVVLFAFLLLKWAKPLPTSADDLKSVWLLRKISTHLLGVSIPHSLTILILCPNSSFTGLIHCEF